jgi:hypothetical protein
MVAMTCLFFAIQGRAADEQDATRKLGALIGRWQSEGTVPETRFSHADKISSSMECRWSPQGNFLICEQAITTSTGKQTQLTVYSYSAMDGNYTFGTFAGPGAEPGHGTVMIKGNVWTYPSSYLGVDGKKNLIRTTNDFSVPGTDTFKTEFSDDNGAHWTTTLQGTAHKLEP